MNLVRTLVQNGAMKDTDVARLQEVIAATPNKALHALIIEQNFAKEEDVLAALATQAEQPAGRPSLLTRAWSRCRTAVAGVWDTAATGVRAVANMVAAIARPVVDRVKSVVRPIAERGGKAIHAVRHGCRMIRDRIYHYSRIVCLVGVLALQRLASLTGWSVF